MFRVRATHGDLFSGDARLADARTFTRLAQEEIPCLLAGDWNGVPAGLLWDDTAINQPELWDQPWKRAHRIRWRHGGRAAWLCASHAEADKLQTQLTSLVQMVYRLRAGRPTPRLIGGSTSSNAPDGRIFAATSRRHPPSRRRAGAG